jgi:hypothetical protein
MICEFTFSFSFHHLFAFWRAFSPLVLHAYDSDRVNMRSRLTSRRAPVNVRWYDLQDAHILLKEAI